MERQGHGQGMGGALFGGVDIGLLMSLGVISFGSSRRGAVRAGKLNATREKTKQAADEWAAGADSR